MKGCHIEMDPATREFLNCLRESELHREIQCKAAGTGKRARRRKAKESAGAEPAGEESRKKEGRGVKPGG